MSAEMIRCLVPDGQGGLYFLAQLAGVGTVVARWDLAAGKAEAGVLNTSVWDKLVEQKKVDPAKVRVFATTPTYYDYNWTVRGNLDPALVKKLTTAFLKLDPAKPADKQIMDLQRASKFIPTTKANYDSIEKAARTAGLLK